MKKVELLSPAGNFKMMESAIHNGADAIYLSGNKFGARKYANNFTNEEIIKAIKYAHLYGVKVYITINTLIKDNEVEEFLEFVDFIHKENVDAVLMQDLGMINLVRKTYPNLEIHASTQFHNYNNEGLEFLKEIGIKRAVLARELSIDEIKNLNVEIEKEVFVHGALCISYSGQCLMSSIIMNRSGNRGECAGMCRLPYKLLENNNVIKTKGKYLLSTKELCTLENLKQILDLNIDSIKIEGRMKSPEYVGYVTRLYRKAIDDYYTGKDIKVTKEEIDNLKVLYNREFTNGYILNNNNNIVNQITPNHQGIEIGKIIEITKKRIKLKLTKELNQGDAIRFKKVNKGMHINYIYDKNDNLINKGNINEIVYIDNKIGINEKDIILKTKDIKLLERINNYPKKKILLNIKIIAKLNNRFKVIFSDGTNTITKEGKLIEKSDNFETTEEAIIKKITKLGNTIYGVNEIDLKIDKNIFIPISHINNIRRSLVEELNNVRENKPATYRKEKPIFKKHEIEYTNTLNILIDNEKDYIEFNKKNINFYTSNLLLYKKYKKNNNIYLRTPRIINTSIKFNKDNILTNDIGTIYNYSKNNNVITDIYSNVTNIYTVEYLIELGVKKINISPELSKEEIQILFNNFINRFGYAPNIEFFIYGKIELMLLKHCIIKDSENSSKMCKLCYNDKNYYLIDRNNNKYKILSTKCGNLVLNCKITNRINDISRLKGQNYYISLIDINNKLEIKKFIEEM